MAYVEVLLGGKSVGIADNAFIDPMIGCSNACVGCYAAKTSRRGKAFFTDEPVLKEFRDDVFSKSCKAATRKGITFARLGKHCDPGDYICLGVTNQILEKSAEEGLRCVFVSKSLGFDETTALNIRQGNHVLHISLGMITKAMDDVYRVRNYRLYKNFGCNAKVRIIADVTEKIPDEYLKEFKICAEDIIITPLRFSSKLDAETYGVNLSKYRFVDGYYRPIHDFINNDWIYSIGSGSWCGETVSQVRDTSEHNTSIKCCNCLVGEQ